MLDGKLADSCETLVTQTIDLIAKIHTKVTS